MKQERKKILDSHLISNENKEDFRKFIRLKNVKEGVSYGRLVNLSSYFYLFCTNFFPDKRILSLEEEDYLDFLERLEEGNIRNKNDKLYSNETIFNYKTFFRSYMRTMLGHAKTEERFGEFHIKRSSSNSKSQTLSYEKVKELIESVPFEDQQMRFAIAFMFSTGCRSQDLRVLRINDFYYDKEGDLIVDIPPLKTEGRSIEINLFKPQIQHYIFDYLKEEIGREEDKLVFSYNGNVPITIQTLNRKIKELVTSSLGKNYEWITSHKFRHFSAVYYSQHSGMNYQQFCYRFGWSVNSEVPLRYFNKKELGKSKIKESMKNDEIQQYEAKYHESNEKIQSLESDVEMLKSMIKKHNIPEATKDINMNFTLNGTNKKEINLNKLINENKERISEFYEKNPKIKKDDEMIMDLIENKISYVETEKSLKYTINDYDIREVYENLSPWSQKFLGNNNYHKFKEIIFGVIAKNGIVNYKAEKLTEQEIELAQES